MTDVVLESAPPTSNGCVSLMRLIVTDLGMEIVIGSLTSVETSTVDEIETETTETGRNDGTVTVMSAVSDGEAKPEVEAGAATANEVGSETEVAIVTVTEIGVFHVLVIDIEAEIGIEIGIETGIETETETETVIRIGSVTEIMIETGAADANEAHPRPAGISAGAVEALNMDHGSFYDNVQHVHPSDLGGKGRQTTLNRMLQIELPEGQIGE
jgi:hypothetical protein